MLPVTELGQEISDFLFSDKIDRKSTAGQEALESVATGCIDRFRNYGGYSGTEVISVLYTLLDDPNQIVSSEQIGRVPDRLNRDGVPSNLEVDFADTMTEMRDCLLEAAQRDSHFGGGNEAYIDVSRIRENLLETHPKLFGKLNKRRQEAMCWQVAYEWVWAVSKAREEKTWFVV